MTTIFQTMGALFDNATATFVSDKSTSLITAITPIAITGVALFLTVYGYMILIGKIQEPFKDFIFKSVKIVFIAIFALNSPFYLDAVVGAINGLQNGLSSALGNPGTTIFEQLDATLDKGIALMNIAFKEAGDADWTDIATIFEWYVIGLIIIIATTLIVVTGGIIIVVASLVLKLLLAVGPLFIMALFFPITARFFDSWFGQAINYIFQIIFVALILAFANEIFARIIAPVDLTAEDVSPSVMALEIIIAAVLLYYILKQVTVLSSSLAGGFSVAAMSLGQLVSNALAPTSAASRAITNARNIVDPAIDKYAPLFVHFFWLRSKRSLSG